ncbi:MAG: ATP-binding protein [Vicinamibacterales bacterium]
MSLLASPTAPPVIDADDRARAAQMFRAIGIATSAIVSTIFPLIGYLQPETAWRAAQVVIAINLVVVATLVLNGRGRTRLACGLYLTLVIVLITVGALRAGGIRSPGVQSFFVFVMLAGLVLGERAGFLTAAAAAIMGLSLALIEHYGLLPPQDVAYTAWVRWLLNCVYIGVALATMRAGTRAIRDALARAQRELAERRTAEHRLSQALEAGSIGLFEYDQKTRRFRGDQRAVALTGLKVDADGTVPYESWERRIHPDDRERFASELREFADGAHRWRTSYRVRLADGTERYLEAAAHAPPGGGGEPGTIVGTIVDATDRALAERERERLVYNLGERMKELRLLHHAAQLLQKSRDLDRHLLEEFVAMMPTAWQFSDDCVARIVYQDIEASSPRWRTSPWTQGASFSTSSGIGLLEVAYLSEHPPADEGPFLTEERALIDSLARMLRSHIEEQIAEQQRRALETQLRQAQKMEALGTLAGGIAHDFNNLLMAIGGNTELALGELPEHSPARESLEEVVKAHHRARDLVKRILLFGRKQKSTRQATELAPVIDEALKLLRASLPATVEIRTTLPPHLPLVMADATQIHQIVLNLATNSAYAMRAAGGVLSVGLDLVTVADAHDTPSHDLAPGPHVRLTVRDTGSGMSEAVRERLFEPFFTTKGHAGTGLGLSVVHGIVRDHGGSITVETQLGFGTTFRIYFPVTASAAPATAHAGVLHGSGQLIAYVDDEEALVLVMSRILERLGYRCSTFTSAAAALQSFQADPTRFAAIITDMQMPGMSGLELARALRAVRADVPIAIASGREYEDENTTFHWLQKPSTLDELSRTVDRMLAQGPAAPV